ncbi:hypothetical protein DFH11DRAFT_6289 [Phellopilus nigrolimitatus]|nr:hypothetical protein DFH11DRAFT_6289 [Phellopilus nigrolimitatus]
MDDAKMPVLPPPSVANGTNISRSNERRARHRRRLGQLGRALLVICATLQISALLPDLVQRFAGTSVDSKIIIVQRPINSASNADPAGEWKDDTWPLRAPTPWDISTDFPFPRTLEYDVDEGTWLRLDVHPTSGEIVFDMLGDLYCLPASSYLQLSTNSSSPSLKSESTKDETISTAARPILLGIPHDSDPRFSPDGSLLVFRSDAELGVENIWVTDWTGCESMNIRPHLHANNDTSEFGVNTSELVDALNVREVEDDMLTNGIKETSERKRRRLLREGRLHAQRVTNETYRWVSDARFHPNGSEIIATKWHTSTRSLGAGEGWLYALPAKNSQIEAGSGRRVVGRELPLGWSAADYGEQQVGPEQFIWHGEDALIFAKNVEDSAGSFNYDKDVHSGIYAIFERNLTTNRTKILVPPSPGGASRPELSRDGRTLAFVRRVRDKEALVLKDLQSGTLHNIWYGLTFDLSVISAPMGTYPSFSFTPNDNAIVIWAAGKLWHIPLVADALGEKVLADEPRIIPFSAHVEKRLAETRASSTDLRVLETAPTQRLHAFVDLTVDDAGARVAFQGAGVSYYLDFDSASSWKSKAAQKVPVLHPEEAYYSPSFVPGNSDQIIHARWSDRNFSTLELADLSTGAAYELSDLPLGRYINPILCSCTGNNRQIAFIKAAGDYLTGNIVATADPGLYIGEITLPDSLTGSGSSVPIRNVRHLRSQISSGEDRTTLKFLDGNKKLLVHQSGRAFVIDLEGGPSTSGDYNHTTIANGLMAAEVTTTVQQDKIAFVDAYNVFVVRKNDIDNEPIWSKPGSATKGIARVSLDGGHHVQWDASGKRLFWLLGPYLHSLEVPRLSKCQSEIEADGVRFGIDCIKDLLDVQEVEVSYPTDIARLSRDAYAEARARAADTQNADVYAITNATALTMVSGALSYDFVRDATLVIRGGIIENVGPASSVAIPHGATVLNADGGFVVPGFIDVHAHWSGFSNIFPARSWELETFLAYGVTTLHNPSSDNVRGFVERGRVENGGMVGPRIFHTGDVIYGAGWGEIHNDVADLNDARSALIRIKAEGGPASFSYKNYNQYSRASRQRLLLEARNLSMLCVPEGGMNQDWDLTYIVDGMTTVEHALPISTLYEDVLTLYALSGTGATPTHIVNYGGTMGEQFVWANVDIANDQKLRRFTRHDLLENHIETTHRPLDSFAFFNTSTSIAKMVRKGLRTHIGAHGEAPLGLIYHAEMAFTAAGGLSNFEVLRAATSDAAITLGIDSAVGSLERGKLADIIVYSPEVDLLQGDIGETLQIRLVVRGGRVWDAETMVEEWPKKGRKALMPIINAD